jgi:hypothetical protein
MRVLILVISVFSTAALADPLVYGVPDIFGYPNPVDVIRPEEEEPECCEEEAVVAAPPPPVTDQEPAAPQVTRAPAAPPETIADGPAVYHWVDEDGVDNYATAPPLKAPISEGPAVYHWVDDEGVDNYSTSVPAQAAGRATRLNY